MPENQIKITNHAKKTHLNSRSVARSFLISILSESSLTWSDKTSKTFTVKKYSRSNIFIRMNKKIALDALHKHANYPISCILLKTALNKHVRTGMNPQDIYNSKLATT